MTQGIETVLHILGASGFERLPKPLIVAGASFDFDAAARGTGVSHDLVVVAMSPESPRRLVRLLSGLSRTLDQVESRRPVSLVLMGEKLDASTIADLERYARVLSIQGNDPSESEVERAVAVLMPLVLPSASRQGRDPLGEVTGALGSSLSNEHHVFLEAAMVGPGEVRDTLRRYVEAALVEAPDERSGS